MNIESALRAKRDAGRKLLVPYVTGGLHDDWVQVVEAVAEAGADPSLLNPTLPVDVSVDHSLSVEALARADAPRSRLASCMPQPRPRSSRCGATCSSAGASS